MEIRRNAVPLLPRGLALIRWAAVVSPLVLAGCAVGPDYQRPASTLDDFHSAAAVEARSAGLRAPELDTWWQGFNDPMLVRLVQRAQGQNLDLAAAAARIQLARGAAKEAGADLLPTVDLDGQAARIHQSLESEVGSVASGLPGYNRNQSDYTLGLDATWELDVFGGLRRGKQAASAEMDAAVAEQTGTRISISADTADAYLRIRGDQARLMVAEQQIATDAHLLDLVRQRFEHEVAAVREVAQAEALLAQARASVQPLRIDLEAQINRLDVLLGQQPGTSAHELEPAQDIPEVPGIDGPDKPVDVLRRRPDVIAAERRLAASNARIGLAITEYYPHITLSGLLGYESSRPADLFKASTFQPLGAAGLRWRIFDFGKVGAEVAQAKGANAEALALYRKSVLHAAEDVENSFTALVQLEAHRQELIKEVDALTRARDASQDAYQGGVSALTDVLDADRQLLAAKDELMQTRADADRAAVGAFRALGGGW